MTLHTIIITNVVNMAKQSWQLPITSALLQQKLLLFLKNTIMKIQRKNAHNLEE